VNSTASAISRLCLVVLLLGAAPPAPAAVSDATQASAKEIKSGEKAMRRGRYDEAIERFEKALEKAPDSIDARLGLAWALLKARHFVPSVEHSVKVMEKAPENARAHALIGMVLMRIGVLGEAASYLQRAVVLDDKESAAHAGLAELALYAGELEEGVRRARIAVSRAPREPDYYYLLGQCAARRELFEEAATAYENYLSHSSDLDADRRARIKGLIQLYRRIQGRSLYFVTGAKSVDVPITFTEARLPYVEVKLNGQGPYRFVIDSGAGFVVVSKRVAKQLKLRTLASGGTSRGVSGTGTFPIVYGILDHLSLGGMTMQSVPTYIREIHDSGHTPVDGYIGLSVLGQFRAAVDYERYMLELRPTSEPVAALEPGDVEVPYRITNGGMLSVRADIGKEAPLNFIVDTGASSTVVSQRAYERFNLQEKEHKGITVRVIGAGGITEDARVVVLDKLALHGVPQTREFVRAIVLDLDPVNEAAGFEQGGIIGNDVLRFFRVEFHFDRGSVVLRPIGSPGAATAVAGTRGNAT
jgi:tetratricopeptide (TPR) repeat protein